MALIKYSLTLVAKQDAPFNVLPNTDVTIRRVSDNGLVLIYSDADGLIPIAQPGAKTNPRGVFEFYTDSLPVVKAVWSDGGNTYEEVFNGNSLQALSGLTEPSDLDQTHRTNATLARLAAGNYSAGSRLVFDELGGAKFDVVEGGVADGYFVRDAGGGNTAVLVHYGEITLDWVGASTTDSDNASAIIAALDSGLMVTGNGKVYPAASPVITTTTGKVIVRDVIIESSYASGDAVDLSSSNDITVKNVVVDGLWDGLSPRNYTDVVVSYSDINFIGFKYDKSNTGIANIENLLVRNWNGMAQVVSDVVTVFARKIRSEDTTYGCRYTGIQSGFIDTVRVRNTRRIGFTCQSSENTTSHDDLQLSNVSVDTVNPGIGSGAALNGIGVEIHNFVDEALATNIRTNKCHSMGLSLSGCEHGCVTNVFLKNTGYAPESDGVINRAYAAIEIVDSDAATITGHILNCWATFIRFDKSHYASTNMICEQTNDVVDPVNIRFVRFQGTADDFNNAAWSCNIAGEFRNNCNTAIPLVSFAAFGTYLNHKHSFNNVKCFNTIVNAFSAMDISGLVLESDGKFEKAGETLTTLLDLLNMGTEPILRNVRYTGLNPAQPPQAFCRINSTAMSGLVLDGCWAEGVTSLITAAAGTLAETSIDNMVLKDVGSLYTGTVSSGYRNQGTNNKQIGTTDISYFPSIRFGNSTAGVSARGGDLLYKRGTSAGVSYGWQRSADNTAWLSLPAVT